MVFVGGFITVDMYCVFARETIELASISRGLMLIISLINKLLNVPIAAHGQSSHSD